MKFRPLHDRVVIRRIEQEITAKFKKVHILINNAGISWAAPAEEMPLEKWREVLDVNLTGAFLVSQAAGREMLKQHQFDIVLVGSPDHWHALHAIAAMEAVAADIDSADPEELGRVFDQESYSPFGLLAQIGARLEDADAGPWWADSYTVVEGRYTPVYAYNSWDAEQGNYLDYTWNLDGDQGQDETS